MSIKEHVKSAKAAADAAKYDSLRIICEGGLRVEPTHIGLLMYHGLACAQTGAVSFLRPLFETAHPLVELYYLVSYLRIFGVFF